MKKLVSHQKYYCKWEAYLIKLQLNNIIFSNSPYWLVQQNTRSSTIVQFEALSALSLLFYQEHQEHLSGSCHQASISALWSEAADNCHTAASKMELFTILLTILARSLSQMLAEAVNTLLLILFLIFVNLLFLLVWEITKNIEKFKKSPWKTPVDEFSFEKFAGLQSVFAKIPTTGTALLVRLKSKKHVCKDCESIHQVCMHSVKKLLFFCDNSLIQLTLKETGWPGNQRCEPLIGKNAGDMIIHVSST